jgi:HEAT repeat protein
MGTDESSPEQHVAQWVDDPRSTEALLAGALDNDEGATCVVALHYRGTREVFEAASALCASPDARERGIGVWILGQIGVSTPTFVEESVDLLLRMLETERDTEILENIAVALGHRRDPRAIGPLVALRHHRDAYVRYGVVVGLMSFDDSRVIDTLIGLSGDLDVRVRDWATFGLGSIQDVDTPAVRAALFARVDDDDEQVRGEAMVGLARRRDPRVTDWIRRELAGDSPGELAIRAAAEFPHESFVPHLSALLELRNAKATPDADIFEAIARCRGPAGVSDP